jgi:hypothetical protein
VQCRISERPEVQAIDKEGAETFSLRYDNPMFATLSYRE